jgi:hypothetical protein
MRRLMFVLGTLVVLALAALEVVAARSVPVAAPLPRASAWLR